MEEKKLRHKRLNCFWHSNVNIKIASYLIDKEILSGGLSQKLSQYMPAFGKTFSNLEAKHLIKNIHKNFSDN
jgi:hypothetical protein